MNNKMIFTALKSLPVMAKKHAPALLTGVGITGMIFTVVSAIKATPKALQIIDEKEIKNSTRLTKSEIVKETWKCYVPMAIVGTCSVACLVGATSVSNKRNAALAAAYAISLQDMSDYKKKVIEAVGEKKESTIRDEVAKEKAVRDHVESMPIIHTGKGDIPCYDYLTKRKFDSDMETLRKAENDLNRRLRDEQIITLNEFFEEIGLDPTSEDIGETLGWDIDNGYIDFHFTSMLVEGVPYLVLGHTNPPRYIGS